MLDPVVGGNTERARKLRRAISIAIDQEEFISIFQNGRGIPAHGEALPNGHFHGVAVANCFGSYNAQVAEVSVERGRVVVHRVTCVVDCGIAVNPAGVVQQMRGGIVYGLSAALRGRITIERGRVEQTNFHQYEPLRIDEMPVVDVHIVPSEADPAGIGEVGTPAIAPAVTNALFRATGKRIRSLPISL